MKDNKTVAVVPGSFDPITVGHLNIISRAAELCDKVFVAVMINSEKKYSFDIHEREAIARAATCDIENVAVISSEAMLYELAKELSAEVIVKGVRNETDRAYEEKMAEFNSSHYPAANTLLLDADPTLSEMSSTLVRTLISDGKSLEGAIPSGAIKEIEKILAQK